MDYYFIEMGLENDCFPETKKGSLSPINSTDGEVITLVCLILNIGHKYEISNEICFTLAVNLTY